MNQTEKIINTTQYLFPCKFDDPAFDADDSYEHSDVAKNLIDELGWDMVFPYWFDYLQRHCPAEPDVVNYMVEKPLISLMVSQLNSYQT